VRAEGKRVAFLYGSPTTNRLDVAVGRKISLLLRLPPANTRSLIARRARFLSRRSIRPPTFRRISRKSVRPCDQMMTHDRIPSSPIKDFNHPSAAAATFIRFRAPATIARRFVLFPRVRRSSFRAATRHAAREIILSDILRNDLAGYPDMRYTDLNAYGSVSDRDYARKWKFRSVPNDTLHVKSDDV